MTNNADNNVSTNDPTVMYLIVRESLAMSPGKMAAQVGHAVQFLMKEYSELGDGMSFMPKEREARYIAWSAWFDADYRKVVLRADDKEFEKVAALDGAVVVVDNGHTQVPEGSRTVVGLPPMKKSERPSILKRLQVMP
jgi:PTH2 family peptidyl-tRNA hydrolase